MNAKTKVLMTLTCAVCLSLLAGLTAPCAASKATTQGAPTTQAAASPQPGKAVQQGIASISFVVLALVLVAIGVCVLIVVQLVFPGLTSCGVQALERGVFRSFLLGLATLVAIVLLALLVSLLSKPLGGLLLVVLCVVLGLIAFAMVSEVLGRRISARSGADRGPAGQLAVGWLVFVGASFAPILGWFVIFPFLTLAGIGAIVQTLWSRKTQTPQTGTAVESETASPTA
jgi:hypothetical protein